MGLGNSRKHGLPAGPRPTIPALLEHRPPRHFLVRVIILLHPDSGFSVCHPIYDDDAMSQSDLGLASCYLLSHSQHRGHCCFLFLPVCGKHMKTYPYFKLITAYPHLCCELGTIARTNICYDDPQSSLNQEIPTSFSAHLGPTNHCSQEHSCKDPSKLSQPSLATGLGCSCT
eukprot:1136596-Pelagomonas_calceolata.AAC.1